ncbi:MAG TPA: holo-ACP synthase [Polyangiaceae bacterium]|nr:holo-ACP synthase [Polyangiaceae bacterium]
MNRDACGAGLTIGTDLVEVAQVAQSLATFRDRYLARVFTQEEIAYCLSRGPESARHLAARFAAKEATFKALRAADQASDWRSVEVRRRADGSCEIVLHGSMRALADRLDVGVLSVSMSHDGAYASAVVVGQRRQSRCAPVSRLWRKKPRGAYER